MTEVRPSNQEERKKNMDSLKNFAADLVDALAERIELRRSEKRLYSVKEAAIYLSCSEEQIDNYVKERGLRRTMIDRRPRYDIRDLDRFIDSAKK
jgi:hypothetical protein